MDEPSTVELSPGEQAELASQCSDLTAEIAAVVDGCLEDLQAVLTARAIHVVTGAGDPEYGRGARAAFLLAVKAVEACRLAVNRRRVPPSPPG